MRVEQYVSNNAYVKGGPVTLIVFSLDTEEALSKILESANRLDNEALTEYIKERARLQRDYYKYTSRHFDYSLMEANRVRDQLDLPYIKDGVVRKRLGIWGYLYPSGLQQLSKHYIDLDIAIMDALVKIWLERSRVYDPFLWSLIEVPHEEFLKNQREQTEYISSLTPQLVKAP